MEGFAKGMNTDIDSMGEREVGETPTTDQKIAELEDLFAPFRRDLSGFRFDLDEANER